MVPFSLFFHYAYTVKPYRLSKIALDQAENGKNELFTPMKYQGGLFNLKMWCSVFIPTDLVRGIKGRQSYSSVAREPLRGQQSEELRDYQNPLLYSQRWKDLMSRTSHEISSGTWKLWDMILSNS